MSMWDGTRWINDQGESTAKRPLRSGWAANMVLMIGLFALLLPFRATLAGSRKDAPVLSTGCATACAVGGSLTVRGTGFTPSAGGQQVILWIDYPDSYCVATTCNGFYDQPWVAADGTFSVTYDAALVQAGEGGVAAVQYNTRTDKWVNIANAGFFAK
jgi:hypothetical protein